MHHRNSSAGECHALHDRNLDLERLTNPDGITDALIKLANEVLWFQYFQNKNRAPYILDQGILGVDLDYAATDHPTANCTISAEAEHVKVEQ